MSPTAKTKSTDDQPTVTVTHPDTDLTVETNNPQAYVLGGWNAPADEPTTPTT